MVKYFFRRFFRGCISVVIAIALIMMMVFSWLDDTLIFAEDEQYVKLSNNQRTLYMYQKWEEYDYLDYVPYTDWLNQLVASGELDEEERSDAAQPASSPIRTPRSSYACGTFLPASLNLTTSTTSKRTSRTGASPSRFMTRPTAGKSFPRRSWVTVHSTSTCSTSTTVFRIYIRIS